MANKQREIIIKYHQKFINSIALGTSIGNVDEEIVEYISGLFDRYLEGLLKELKKNAKKETKEN